MNIFICDDNSQISEDLKKHVLDYFKKNKWSTPLITIFNSGDELLKSFKQPDILFLDIEMPGLNGIYVGSEIKKRFPDAIIIIVTSFSDYLDDAMRINVFRYLSKPIDKLRLYRNLKDALKLYSSLSSKIVIETENNNITIYTKDIIYIETINRRTLVHSVAGDYNSTQPISYWINNLNQGTFYRCHRSYIINLSFVNSFDHDSITLTKKAFTVYLSRRKYTEFKSAYLQYIESRS